MTSTSRNGLLKWASSSQTAPPAACNTLRNFNNVVEWGYTCTFPEEAADSTLLANFPINTACMPWVTLGVFPATNAFYSPASACPDAWTAVATQTSGTDWLEGETELTCCPSGFEGNNNGDCSPASSASFPVVECGEADAEENEFRTYVGGAWPASATVSVAALQLRYGGTGAVITGTTGSENSPSSTGGTSSSDSNNGNNNGNGDRGSSGLSTGAKAAIGTVIPLVFLLGALALFIFWRRRKAYKAGKATKWLGSIEPKPGPVARSEFLNSTSPVVGAGRPGRRTDTAHETPEWNVEMDARETERYHAYRPVPESDASGAMDDELRNPSELDGAAKQRRKPLPSYEIDGMERVAELEGREGRKRHELP
jgi:hypothetical protein